MMWKIIAIALFAFITYWFGDVSYSIVTTLKKKRYRAACLNFVLLLAMSLISFFLLSPFDILRSAF